MNIFQIILVQFKLCCPGTNAAVERVFSFANDFWTNENVTDIAKDGATEFSNIFSTLPGFENCGIKEITDWLNRDMEDAGFQLLNDEEIIAEVRHSPKEEDDGEGENDFQVKISINDAFECFSKGLA
ncbi:hypothetical protein AVEN_165700-1 [Araneus ventricosus]|uniref:HAT C-terminal dimerisation domain-containing protein n=1 Tax=Araneus ventricosus TaxID=182803 RepID=A0A4Y2C517_ARAVE|nr:hypothetical protein AVEN_165700-1 [Araneus ventricosus]